MASRTKIVATVGPACDDETTLRRMVDAGVSVFRLNLSHGSIDEHRARLARCREVARGAGRPVAMLADLPGPKIRSGSFGSPGVLFVEGSEVVLVPGGGESDEHHVEVDYPPLLEEICVGDRVVLGDGAITLQVQQVEPARAVATVTTGGSVQGRPGVHLASARFRLRAPTPEDLALVEAFAPDALDYFAVSFVRSAEDLQLVRKALGEHRTGLVAKIETAAALDDLDAIIAAADAVMVARGDLGIECALEDVPHHQKLIIERCIAAAVPVITATQMLESMITAPAPTRAEASDVANAVYDGTDALMLSAETAIGAHPVLAVRTMARIAERAEVHAQQRRDRFVGRRADEQDGLLRGGAVQARITAALTHAAWQAARHVGASAILCCTRSGLTARAMARFRPPARLIGLSPSAATARRLALSWGVEPLAVAEYASTDEMVWCAVEAAVNEGLVDHGDTVVVLAGAPDTSDPVTDVLRLVRVA